MSEGCGRREWEGHWEERGRGRDKRKEGEGGKGGGGGDIRAGGTVGVRFGVGGHLRVDGGSMEASARNCSDGIKQRV
jgi:hypothetical protein